MHIVVVVLATVIRTKGILGSASSVIDHMDKTIMLEGLQGTVNRSTVGRVEPLFNVAQADGGVLAEQEIEHQYPHRSRLDMFRCQFCFSLYSHLTGVNYRQRYPLIFKSCTTLAEKLLQVLLHKFMALFGQVLTGCSVHFVFEQ